MSRPDKPEVLRYFETLEEKYSVDFTFDVLTLHELRTLESLTREAIDSDHGLDRDDQRNLGVLLKLVGNQLAYRQRSHWLGRRTAAGT